MYREMEKAGQPDPTYVQNHFILRATLKAKTIIGDNIPHETTLEDIIMEAI
jgi:ATP-dependent DNA helicase RecG